MSAGFRGILGLDGMYARPSVSAPTYATGRYDSLAVLSGYWSFMGQDPSGAADVSVEDVRIGLEDG